MLGPVLGIIDSREIKLVMFWAVHPRGYLVAVAGLGPHSTKLPENQGGFRAERGSSGTSLGSV